MTDEIIDNLKKIFSLQKYSESDIVYILVEIYKFLEQKEKLEQTKFRLINFYRNWVCHHCLDRNNSARYFFKEIEQAITEDINLNRGEDAFDKAIVLLPKAISCFSFLKLRLNLENFSREYLDETSIGWESFRDNLYKIIVHQPLKIKMKKELIFQYNEVADSAVNDSLKVYLKVGDDNRILPINDTIINSY